MQRRVSVVSLVAVMTICLAATPGTAQEESQAGGAAEPSASATKQVSPPAAYTEQVVEVPNATVQIAGAVAAAPPDLRDGARVLAYDANGELVLARKGTNHLTCLADDPSKEGFHSACYQDGLEAYMARGRELRKQGVFGPDNLDRRHDEINAGKLYIPRTPSTVYTLGGPDAKQDPVTGEVTGGKMLYAIYIPFATPASTGLSTTPEMKGAPWIMRPGTPTAHIMVYPPQPEETKPEEEK